MAGDPSQVAPQEVAYTEDRDMFVEVVATIGIRGIVHRGVDSTRAELGAVRPACGLRRSGHGYWHFSACIAAASSFRGASKNSSGSPIWFRDSRSTWQTSRGRIRGRMASANVEGALVFSP